MHIVLFDGVEELDFAAPLQSLGIAGRFGAPIEITLVAVDGPRSVRASHGTEIKADGAWAPDAADLILVPGGGPAGTPTSPASRRRSGGERSPPRCGPPAGRD